MLSACRSFKQEAGRLDSDQPLFRAGNEVNIQKFIAALAAMRKVFGLHVFQLSQTYRIDVPEELVGLVPLDNPE